MGSAFLFLAQLISLYMVVLFLRILLSWVFPPYKWGDQPLRLLDQVTTPVLEPFRRIIPPIGGVLDISPMVVFILLELLQNLLQRVGYSMMAPAGF